VISDLENMGRVLMITSIDITTDKQGIHSMNIKGEAGYLPDPSL
jgi:hypothetical protein